ELRPARIVLAEQRERLTVVAEPLRLVEAARALGGEGPEPHGQIVERVRELRVAGGARQLESGRVMVRQQLGALGSALAADALDPGGGRDVLPRSRSAGDLRVGDVADEHVREDVLRVALDRRAAGPPDELLADELVEPLHDAVLREAADPRERAGPED